MAIAVDFKKTHDSVKWQAMVEILKELKMDSKVVDFIIRIYWEDSTKIQREESRYK